MRNQRNIAGLKRGDRVYALLTPARLDAAGLTLRVLRDECWHLVDASPDPHSWQVMTRSDPVLTLKHVLRAGFGPLGVIPVMADLHRIRLALGLSFDQASIPELVELAKRRVTLAQRSRP